MTKDDLTQLLIEEVKGLDNYLVADDYSNALDDAARETWALPVTTDFRIFWVKERAKRHLFFYLMTESAHKFKYKQINLQQRFEHYKEIIFGKGGMDEKFAEAIEENPAEFSGVDTFKMFGTKVDAGFAYDDVGQDISYREEYDVVFTPTENE
jgi:hypothetical protein